MFVIKRQRLCGIHSGQREVHDYLTQSGTYVEDQSKARHVPIHGIAQAIAACERDRNMPGVLSIVVREHRS